MKRIVWSFVLGLGLVLGFTHPCAAQGSNEQAIRTTNDQLIAIDVLLQPDQTMIDKANASNARLRGDYSSGYALDATHAPHVTMLQRFVRVKDLDALTKALTKLFATERPTDLQLKATGYDYTIWSGVAVTIFVVERTPELMRLQQKVTDTVAPFSVSGGSAAAFIDTPSNSEIVGYVEQFVPKSSGEHYFPHVTLGVAHEAFVKQLKAEPFETFTFSPKGVAVYQLGNFGVAAKKLWQSQAGGPLASWNDGAAKQSIIDFVKRVTTEGSPDFVPVPERIATFDNDGTLWCEQPLPVQLYFVLDRVKALAPQHPEWKNTEPFASVLRGDLKGVAAGGERAILEIIMATHAGMTTTEFKQIVKDWIATAKNPKTGKLFTEMTYQPMHELLAYLRANGFKTFIVSGGGVEFMRPWAEQVYGIPPEQIIGSTIKTKFELRDGRAVLVRLPELNFNDDKAGKAISINQYIGRRPIMAFGNSNGDREMLEYTQSGGGARFELLVLHDDGAREFAYGPARGLPDVQLGAFKQDLYDQAKKEGWTVVSMKEDWEVVFGFEKN
ncbi:MAG TPA: haloacid dehalogenase-like hydrolase [Candidatus Sulfotelmatobacter sp.]|nr:haloacid dehalogenase-like hydrolase [Candidatus Sulfotelmatobacter sp.]